MVDIKLEGIEEAIEMFEPAKVWRAATSTVNEMAGQAKTFAPNPLGIQHQRRESRINSQ